MSEREKLIQALHCHADGRCGECPYFTQLQDNQESTLITAVLDCKKSLFTEVLSELDSMQLQLIEKDCEINDMKAKLSWFKAWSDRVCGLPNCNSCGDANTCVYKPDTSGQLTRFNCPLWCIPEEI